MTLNLRAGRPANNLLDFRRVPMLADAVGRDAFVALGKQRRQLRRSSAPETPLLLSTMMSFGSIKPAFKSGASGRIADVG